MRNIVTGRVAPGAANAGLSVQIGTAQLREFEESLPDGINSTISKKVVTMSVNRKALKVESTRVVDANLTYNRVLELHQSRGVFSLIKYCITNYHPYQHQCLMKHV